MPHGDWGVPVSHESTNGKTRRGVWCIKDRVRATPTLLRRTSALRTSSIINRIPPRVDSYLFISSIPVKHFRIIVIYNVLNPIAQQMTTGTAPLAFFKQGQVYSQ
jgi:hypothetical protein